MRNMAKLYSNYAGKRDQEQRHFKRGEQPATQVGSQIFLTSFWPNQIAARKTLFQAAPKTSSSC